MYTHVQALFARLAALQAQADELSVEVIGPPVVAALDDTLVLDDADATEPLSDAAPPPVLDLKHESLVQASKDVMALWEALEVLKAEVPAQSTIMRDDLLDQADALSTSLRWCEALLERLVVVEQLRSEEVDRLLGRVHPAVGQGGVGGPGAMTISRVKTRRRSSVSMTRQLDLQVGRWVGRGNEGQDGDEVDTVSGDRGVHSSRP